MSAAARRGAAVVGTALLLLLTACTSLPESGPIEVEVAAQPDAPLDAPNFRPPGPVEDASQGAIVAGFLTSMQANPLSTTVAREFLSERTRSTWQPNRGTIVYEAFSVLTEGTGVRLRLSDVRRLDARGGWQGGSPGQSESIDVDLVQEDGEWRIDNPIEALVVPTSFFNRSFVRQDLFFFDQTNRVLLPDPVFIPRGEQSATNLTRGLLEGPGPTLSEVSRSAFPRGTELELSVVVSESGVAEVPLTRELLRAAPAVTERAMQQLSWTLGQVPGINRIRLTVAGAAVPLPSGVIDVPVSRAADLDAAGDVDPTLLGVVDGSLVQIFGDSVEPVPGALGTTTIDARSLAASDWRVAAVSEDGTMLSTAPLVTGEERGAGLQPLVAGTDLTRPSFDLFDDLWVVDRTRAGARVLLHDGSDRAREVPIDGVSGENVVAATISHDGARLAVLYGDRATQQVRVVDVLRTEEGKVSGGGRSRVLPVARDEAAVVDVGWRDPATLALLSRAGEDASRVDFVSSDGAPVISSSADPAVFRGAAEALVVSPRADVPLRLVAADNRLHVLTAEGSWPREPARARVAAYAP